MQITAILGILMLIELIYAIGHEHGTRHNMVSSLFGGIAKFCFDLKLQLICNVNRLTFANYFRLHMCF